MTDLVKNEAVNILSRINSAQNILLHLHPSPDPDSVGGALAMSLVLDKLGKKNSVIGGDSKLPKSLSFLPGFNRIKEQNFFETDLSKFDLFLIQDSGDLRLVSAQGEVVFPENLVTQIIDHHSGNPKYAKFNLVDSSYPANAQVLADLFECWGVEIDADIAINLICGIYADTGSLKYSGTSVETFATMAKLVAAAPNFSEAIQAMNNSNIADAIKGKGLALDNITEYFHSQVTIGVANRIEMQARNLNPDDVSASEIAANIVTVIGWEIAVGMVEKEADVWRISFRSRGKFNVADIAKATDKGGGHPLAAAAQIEGDYKTVLEFLLKTIQTVYPKLK